MKSLISIDLQGTDFPNWIGVIHIYEKTRSKGVVCDSTLNKIDPMFSVKLWVVVNLPVRSP